MSSPKRRRKLPPILARQENRCALCGCALTPASATLDHIIPDGVGGPDSTDNLRAVCWPCNQERGRKDEAAILKIMRDLDMEYGKVGPFHDPKELREEAKKIQALARERWQALAPLDAGGGAK